LKKVLIITDSLGAPRAEPELLKYEDTYTYKIKRFFKEKDVDVYIIAKSGLTSNEIVAFLDYYLSLYDPDLLLMHFGIVDCAPRAFTLNEIKVANIFRFGFLLKWAGNRYHYFLTKLRKIKRVDVMHFKKNLNHINELCINNEVKLVCIPILAPTSEYIKTSYDINKSINEYNDILKQNSNMVDIDYYKIELDKIFMSDKHHLNAYGCNFIYNETMKLIVKVSR